MEVALRKTLFTVINLFLLLILFKLLYTAETVARMPLLFGKVRT